jgi:hypothetical protein
VLPEIIYGFSGGKKPSSFIFGQNIARVKIRVAPHMFTGSLAGINKLLALVG